jgi:hypothetical protein
MGCQLLDSGPRSDFSQDFLSSLYEGSPISGAIGRLAISGRFFDRLL